MRTRAVASVAVMAVGLFAFTLAFGQFRAGDVVPDHYIVVLRAGASPGDVARDHGLIPSQVYTAALNGFAAFIPSQRLSAVSGDPRVDFVEPDVVVEAFPVRPEGKPTGKPGKGGGGESPPPQTVPTGINRIDADLSPTAKIGQKLGANQVNADIAIIDTGIAGHPDLNLYVLATCVTGEGFEDKNGHGTHVAGTAAALDNDIGVVGVAPGARLWSVKVLNKNGWGFLSWVICGVNFVTERATSIEVANMSLGFEGQSLSLDLAIANSVDAGVVYTVAAGNSAKDASTFSPANHPDVLAVSALADSDGQCGGGGPATKYGPDDTLASFSNFGAVVDIAAPGVSILSTYKGGAYATLSGTSMASPHVAGVAALYLATHSKPTNAAGVAAVRDALITGGVPQSQGCISDGNGGFAGDPDGFPEPLVYAGRL